MSIPELNEFGVLPPGHHDCIIREIAARFSTNDHRRALWADFLRFMEWAGAHPRPLAVLVDGSFTSDKMNPSDIDIVFDLTGCTDPCVGFWAAFFVKEREQVKKKYRVDFWVYLPGADNDLRAFFEYIKPNEAIQRGMSAGAQKGLLRIEP